MNMYWGVVNFDKNSFYSFVRTNSKREKKISTAKQQTFRAEGKILSGNFALRQYIEEGGLSNQNKKLMI